MLKNIKMKQDLTYLALKYPDFHTWRDLDAAMTNNGRWPDGRPVCLSDPEMKPRIDDLLSSITETPDTAREWLKKVTPDNYEL